MSALELTEELLTDIVEESGITKMITDMKLGSEKYDEYTKEVGGNSLKNLDKTIDKYMEEIKEYLDKKDNKNYTAMMYVYLFSRFCDEYQQSGAMTIGDEKCEYGERYDDEENEAIFDFFSKKLKDYKDGDEIVIERLQINLHADEYYDYDEDTLRSECDIEDDEYISSDILYDFLYEKHSKTYRPMIDNFVDHVCKYYDVKITVNRLNFHRVG